MKKWLCLIILSFNSCITLTVHGLNDGYTETAKNGYSVKDLSKSKEEIFPFTNSDSIQLKEIIADSMKDVVSKYDTAWINFWGTWCPHCVAELPVTTKYALDHHIAYIPVATDYYVKNMKKLLSQAGYRGTAFIISNQKYGRNEYTKLIQFEKELTGYTDSVADFPTHMLLVSGKLVNIHKGEMDVNSLNTFFGYK